MIKRQRTKQLHNKLRPHTIVLICLFLTMGVQGLCSAQTTDSQRAEKQQKRQVNEKDLTTKASKTKRDRSIDVDAAEIRQNKDPDRMPQDSGQTPQDPDQIPQDPDQIPQDPDQLPQDPDRIPQNADRIPKEESTTTRQYQPAFPSGDLLTRPLPAKPSVPAFQRSHQNGNLNSNKAAAQNQSFEAAEFILISETLQTAKQHGIDLQTYGLQLRSRERYPTLGFVVSHFEDPQARDTQKLLQQLQSQHPNFALSLNHRFELSANRRKTYASKKIGWESSEQTICKNDAKLKIGMLDTAVDTRHPSLANASIQSRVFVSNEVQSSDHGTAIAALLVGNGQQDIVGLLPQATLFAASIFREKHSRIDTTTMAMLRALEWLGGEAVDVINVSLGGPDSMPIQKAMSALRDDNITVVAAAGNFGPEASPTYPAAYDSVLAITASDAANNIYTQANQGSYIFIAAPGVDIWSAKHSSGGKYFTGTSFATPFAVAVASRLQGDTAAKVETLKRRALDLGVEGYDPIYGWGLIQSATCQQ